jgi:uncharacterized protein YdeI (YjbR/CyaY-like superfamily)
MKITNALHVRTRDQWRRWLQKHHTSQAEIWLVFDRKCTGRACIEYDAAVEEALCFGWIDGILKKMDDDQYGRRFTPRRASSKWSALNKRRAAKMIEEGRMTEAGRATLNYAGDEDGYGRTPASKAEELVVPACLAQALLGNRAAAANFERLAPSYRRNYIRWIAAAKTDQTRDKRVSEAVALLVENRRLGPK